MKYVIKIDNQTVTLQYDGIEDHINIDGLTTIDSTNIYGENTNISSDLNRIGLLKGEAENNMALAKMEEKVYVGNFVANLRRQAANNAGKYKMVVDGETFEVKATEKALETCFHTDKGWQDIRYKYIESERNFNALNSLYWSIEDKSKRLNPLQKGTTLE